MKKFLMTLFAAQTLFSSAAFAQSQKEILNICGTKDMPVVTAGYTNYPPFSWKVMTFKGDEEYLNRYEYRGFVYDTVKDSLKEADIVFQDYFQDDYEKLKREIKHGKADVFFTAYYEDEKKSNVDYIFPAYFGNPFVVVSLQEKPLDVSSFDALSGLRGVVRNEEGIRQLIQPALPTDTKVDWVEGPREAFKRLLTGQADFMISSPYAAVAEARRFKVYDRLHISQTPLRSIKLFAAWSKMSQCRHLRPKFVENFNRLMKDPVEKQKRLNAAIEEWIAQNEGEEPLFENDEPPAQSESAETAPEQPADDAPAPQTEAAAPAGTVPESQPEQNAALEQNAQSETAEDASAVRPATEQQPEPSRPRVQTFRKFKARARY